MGGQQKRIQGVFLVAWVRVYITVFFTDEECASRTGLSTLLYHQQIKRRTGGDIYTLDLSLFP